MNIKEAKKLALNPGAFHHADKFIVINGETKRPVESHSSMGGAVDAMVALNQHEERNGRAKMVPLYCVEPVTE